MVQRRISWLGIPDLDWFFYFQIHKLEGKALEDRWEQIKIHLSDLMIMVLSAAKFLAPVDQIWTLQLSQFTELCIYCEPLESKTTILIIMWPIYINTWDLDALDELLWSLSTEHFLAFYLFNIVCGLKNLFSKQNKDC